MFVTDLSHGIIYRIKDLNTWPSGFPIHSLTVSALSSYRMMNIWEFSAKLRLNHDHGFRTSPINRKSVHFVDVCSIQRSWGASKVQKFLDMLAIVKCLLSASNESKHGWWLTQGTQILNVSFSSSSSSSSSPNALFLFQKEKTKRKKGY